MSKIEKNLHFPKDFLWGASTSAHQVEGGNNNDWTEWEESSLRMKKLVESGLIEQFGMENFLSKKTANHYHLFKEDFQLAKDLGHNAARFSIEWSRVEPEEGKFSETEIKRYVEVVKHLRTLGIEPFVTLWHWTIPVWLKNIGGWSNKKTGEHFVCFAEKMVKSLGEDVRFWMALNEPEIYTSNSYFTGIWPPEKKSTWQYLKVLHHLITAHKKVYKTIKLQNPNAQVGIAKNNIYFEPHKNRIHNRALKKIIHWWWNDYFLNRIKKHQDFIGLNYYFHNVVNMGFIKNENKIISDLGWELYPEGIFHVLKDLKKYNKPIYITENGVADAGDVKRKWFLVEIIKQLHKAIEVGIDVRGYLHWSLLDNFEWADGFRARFGLVEVDFKTQERKPRGSAHLYKKIAGENGLTEDMLKNHEESIL
jgi:beta-glucosidase